MLMIRNFFRVLLGAPLLAQPFIDATDDELPYEAQSTWDNLEEAYYSDEY